MKLSCIRDQIFHSIAREHAHFLQVHKILSRIHNMLGHKKT